MRTFKARLVEQQQRRITNTRAGMNHLATLVQVAAATPTIQSFPYRLVAYQLTLIDATLFAQIPPEAILSHSARNPHPRVQASIDLFNYVTRLVEHSLLSLDEPAARASMLHRWSKVAKALRDLRSYQMLLAVVGGLQTPPIRRLKRTWTQVPKRDLQRVQRLQRLVSPDNNYSRYRELLGKATSSGWHVPCVSVFLLDATYLVSA
ncbi:ras guanine nucleotide exchange factor domain-containing protein, partial [Syncephalis pseudoplumigaleata]